MRLALFLGPRSVSCRHPWREALALFLILGSAGISNGSVHPTHKRAVIEQLQQIKQRDLEQINKTQEQLRERLAESKKITMEGIDSKSRSERNRVDEEIRQFGMAIDQLQQARDEAYARRDIMDQLILAVNNRWDGLSPLKGVLVAALDDMAVVEATSGLRPHSQTKFFSYLSLVLREGFDNKSERVSDIVSLVREYMTYSTIQNPRLPSDFLRSRSYTNGYTSMAAKTASTVVAGDYADRHIRKQEEAVPAVITQRSQLRKLAPELSQGAENKSTDYE